MAKRLLPVGIDDMALYVPQLYLDLRVLAEKRDLPFEKLSRGLGLNRMALCDVHEDAATMAAEAVAEIIDRNSLDPRRIGRLYLGTESALDMAKPTGTYALDMLRRRYAPRYGEDCFRRCDVLDMTFACIGATDALHNTLDWVASDPENNIGIVVASDVAKYELGSPGEYTQGAGAVAMLVRHKPRLLVVRRMFGVATESVHDFFKPRRERFSETPVFDGQYSNRCYQNRMLEALEDFRNRALETGLFGERQFMALSDRWARMIFHLPYAFHARRMYVEAFVLELKAKGMWEAEAKRNGWLEPLRDAHASERDYDKSQQVFLKEVSEGKAYQRLVREKLEKAQWASSDTGNLYTASIFLALMGTLEADVAAQSNLSGKRLGFVAYGSGSKAKVFEGIVQSGWAAVATQFGIARKLATRRAVDYDQYEALHTGVQQTPVFAEQGRWGLERIGQEGVKLGARYYGAFGIRNGE